MKFYEEPKMEIVNIAVEDIITTSNKDEGGAGDWE